MSEDPEERQNELLALQSIFTSEEFVRENRTSGGEIRVSAELPEGFTVSIQEGRYTFSVSFIMLTLEVGHDFGFA